MNKKMNRVNRREFLAAGTALAAFRALGAFAAPLAGSSLRQCAAERGITFGSALSIDSMNDAMYAPLFAEQCGILVPESEMKWAALRPSPQKFDFVRADALCSFAAEHHLAVRGHTLVWENALPSWFSVYATSSNAEQLMTDHISTVVRRFAGKVAAWDVVNEAVQMQDAREDGLKKTPWLRLIGPEYIELAFRAAHEADPKAMLIYNENWIEPDDLDSERRRRAVLNLLMDLKKRNVPVHGLGIQSHIFAEANVTGANFQTFLREIEALGLSILITELDVRDQHLPADIQTRDRMVAAQYEKYLSFLLQFESVKTVLTWGLSDHHTWIADHNRRPDGLPVRPLPYDSELKPKPAWQAMQSAFAHASKR
jgi:endo-1,4-beta-xylanase